MDWFFGWLIDELIEWSVHCLVFCFSFQRLQAKIVKTVDISYGGENGFNQAIELSADCLANVKFVQEKKLIGNYTALFWLLCKIFRLDWNAVLEYADLFFFLGHFFDEISQDSGKVCFGVDDTLKCLEMGACETLICWENLDIMRYELRNPSTGEKKVVHQRGSQPQDKSHFNDKEVRSDIPVVGFLN